MRQQEETAYRRNKNYIDGNTVRKMEAVPEHRSDEVHEQLKHKQEQDRAREQQQHSARMAARRNQQKAMRMSPGYVAFLALAMTVMVGVCGVYLQIQSEITGRMKHIATLEGQVLDLKTDNDATLKRINTSINMEEVKNTAIHELGMVYPAEDQIKYFEVNATDYMNQYEDIPEK